MKANLVYARTLVALAEKALGHTLSDGQRRDLLKDRSTLTNEEIDKAVNALDALVQHVREIHLPVSDYSDDFERCSRSTHDAEMAFRNEAKEAKVTVTRVVAVVFDEFDSNNPSHACAYFDVTWEGDEWPAGNE